MYGSMGETEVGTENTRKAYELRDRASDNEKFFITAYYDGRATGNQQKAQQTCEAWAQAYPREWKPHSFLAGFIYPVLGEHEKAAEEAQKTIELAPDFGVGYALLGSNSLSLDRLGAAEDAVRRASERRVEIPLLARTLRWSSNFTPRLTNHASLGETYTRGHLNISNYTMPAGAAIAQAYPGADPLNRIPNIEILSSSNWAWLGVGALPTITPRRGHLLFR
jgi:tetratricopeptide (TPR) repeat protein